MKDDASRSAEAPEDFLPGAWRRVKDHRIAQWTVGYVALAYGIQHAVTLTSEAFEWPNIVARATMLILILGVPLAMVFAWYHGERTTRRISAGEMTLASLLLVLISLVFYAVVRPAEHTAAANVQQASVTAARAAAASPKGTVSVAVLPFENLSADKDQEFFSDGMTEEITAALAKVPDLRVVARTSAFQFKAQNRDIQSIGQQLHATHFIEGSVRKAGDRVRITAQLIRADDGSHIWAESYDRQLTDIFAVQEDIARAVATSLHMTLGLKPNENLVNARARDTGLHLQYLRARNLVRTRLITPTNEAIRLLNDVVQHDPNFAPAWAALAQAYQGALIIDPEVNAGTSARAKPVVEDYLRKIERAANEAIRLDPETAEAYCALSIVRQSKGDFITSWDLRQRGLSIDPDSPECLQSTNELAHLGFVKEALSYRDHLMAIEPFVPAYRGVAARELFADGQYDAAVAMAQSALGPRGYNGRGVLAQIYAANGRYSEAADILAATDDPAYKTWIDKAVRILRNAPNTPAVNDRPELGVLNWVYVYAGLPDRFMSMYENELLIGYQGGVPNALEWAPAYREIRKTERFKKWIRDSGIYAYWKAKGWPAQCHPTTADDFECS